MRRGLLIALAALAVIGAGLWLASAPRRLPPTAIAAVPGDAGRGQRIFWAGGCASCHAAAGSKGDALLRLGGGMPLKTAFGTFRGPNISPDAKDGIGAWRLADFANAMQRGVDRDGRHLYPAFPYSSYIKMTSGDVADLYAYLRTLPPVAGQGAGNELGFPFNIRRGVGLWKLLFLGDSGPVVPVPADAQVRAGQYLVEGPGHCGQCHTARGLGGLGGFETGRWLGGAKSVEGAGGVPNITPSKDGIGTWSAAEIAEYLETGFTPEYDSVGGPMVAVQENMARLPAEDRAAIAAYLKAVAPVAKAGG